MHVSEGTNRVFAMVSTPENKADRYHCSKVTSCFTRNLPRSYCTVGMWVGVVVLASSEQRGCKLEDCLFCAVGRKS